MITMMTEVRKKYRCPHSFRLTEEADKELSRMAEEEGRSLSNMLNQVILRYVETTATAARLAKRREQSE